MQANKKLKQTQVQVAVVDAFARKAFEGNPAAVILEEVEEAAMPLIAREMNLSETAFAVERESESKEVVWDLRWLTPKNEVNLCGHATLATAHTIFASKRAASETLRFRTKSGELVVTRHLADGDAAENALYAMDFPKGTPAPLKLDHYTAEFKVLKQHLNIMRCDILAAAFCPKTRKLLVEVESTDDIDLLRPNVSGLLSLKFPSLDVWGIIVTTKTDNKYKKYDFVSRYFAPWVGINEDPVTGSAHTVLGVYWANKLQKEHLLARQDSERGGDLDLTVAPNSDRIIIKGSAKTVMKGELKF